MRGTAARAVAAATAAATAAAGTAVFWLAVRLPSLGVEDPTGSAATAPFVIGMVLLATAGALLVRQTDQARIGWLMLATGLTGVLARLALALAVLEDENGHATASVLGWVTNWAWLPMQGLALVLILRFPDGRLPSRHFRWVELVVLAWALATVLVTAVLPGPLGAEQLAPRTNPVGITALGDGLDAALEALFLLQPVLLLAAVAAPVLRWRGASATERRQLTAVALALLLVAATAPLALATGAGEVLEGVAWLVLPAAIAYAAARHGLWDIDLRRRLDRLRLVREEERGRLQRDLHDSLGPLLGAITMRVEAARNLVAAQAPTDHVDRLLASIGEEAETAVVEVRRLIDELGPSALADADLVTAIRRLVDRYADTELQVTLSVPPDLPPLEPSAEIAVYRVIGEALRNVVRHADASRCHVSLRADGRDVVVDVVDDGRGLRGQPEGVGRRAMEDRVLALGGRFALSEPADGGVHVSARLEVAGR